MEFLNKNHYKKFCIKIVYHLVVFSLFHLQAFFSAKEYCQSINPDTCRTMRHKLVYLNV